MGKPKCYSSKDYDFSSNQKVTEKGQGDNVLLYHINLAFLHVHRWARYLFISSWSYSAPVAALWGGSGMQFQHNPTSQSYWR